MDMIRIVILLGAVQGLITFLVLFSYRNSHKKANYFLSFAVLMMAMNLFADYFLDDRAGEGFLNHAHLHPLTGFAFGPLIYFYVRAMAGFTMPKKSAIALHFVPFCGACIYVALWLMPLPGPGPGRVLAEYFVVIEVASLLYMLSFTVMAIALLVRHERAIRNSFSNVKNLSLMWLRLIIISTAVIMLCAAAFYVWRGYFDILWLMIAFLIYVMSYMTLRKPEIIAGQVDLEKVEKYRNSPVNGDMLREGRLAIDRLMAEDRLYLDNEITLPLLAEKAALPLHHVSQILNQAYQQSFYEFISHHRIRAAKEMMLSPEFDEQKIIDICYRVGFNTISAFNKAFKKDTGMTPTQFRSGSRKS